MDYALFLKTKQGDFNSIRYLINDKTTPFFDLISASSGDDPEQLELRVSKFQNNIIKHWNKDALFFIDHYDINLSARLPDGSHPYSAYLDLMNSGYNVGLITGIDRDDPYNDAIINLLLAHENRPVAIRLLIDDISAPAICKIELEDILQKLAPLTENIYLIFDCRVIFTSDLDELAGKIENFTNLADELIGQLPIIVTSSTIPAKIADVLPTGSECRIARKEVILWDKLCVKLDSLIYGDYGTVSPDFYEIDANGPIPIVPKIIYTCDDQYYIQRGKSVFQHPDGYRQFERLAHNVTLEIGYRNSSYSFGDRYISIISDSSNKKTGNATTWITACMNQHLAFLSTSL